MRLVKKTKKVRHSLLMGFMAVVMASLMTIPAFAAEWVGYAVDEDSEWNEYYEAFDDEANGVSWDGADTVTLTDASLLVLEIGGDATVQLEGENSVTMMGATDEGSLTVVGDKDAVTEDKPVLNLVGAQGMWDESDSVAELYGSEGLTIEGVTVNISGDTDMCFIGAGGGVVTIDCTKIATEGDDTFVYLISESESGTLNIVDSVIDIATGTVGAQGLVTIDNSDVSVGYPPYAEEAPEGVEGYPVIMSYTGIELKNMANGEIIQYEMDEAMYYAITGDEDGVYLKAAGTPGYYVQASDSGKGGMPATGDATPFVAFAGAAVCALAAMAFARRRVEA